MLGVILEDFIKILKEHSGFRIVYSLGEADHYIDLLAKLGSKNSTELCSYDNPPQDISLALFANLSSTIFIRDLVFIFLFPLVHQKENSNFNPSLYCLFIFPLDSSSSPTRNSSIRNHNPILLFLSRLIGPLTFSVRAQYLLSHCFSIICFWFETVKI